MNALSLPVREIGAPAPADARDSLVVRDLRVSFETRGGTIEALRGVSFEVAPGERLGLVGESGSGKSVACLSIMGLLERTARITSGSVTLRGAPLLGMGRTKAGGDLAMVFQYPRTALNPIRRIGDQMVDVLRTLSKAPRKELLTRAAELLAEVQISRPEERLRSYPFELSGGQCQRVLIAMALARRPAVLLADEPTTGLDVVTQRAILELIDRARLKRRMGTVLVTHDLALASEFCDRIVVMKLGAIVEAGTTEQIFEAPQHPYTRALLAATPAVATSLDALRVAVEEEPRV
jgi:peptide/nickel transport system ATP-binding protein